MDNSTKLIVFFFFVVAILCLAVGWGGAGFGMIAIACVLISESYQAKKKKAAEEGKMKEPLVQIDLGKGKVLTDEEKIDRLPVSIDNLKYQNDVQLNETLPRISAMYGISMAALWAAVNAAKAKLPKVCEEDKQFWEDFYTEDRELDEVVEDLELDVLDEEERQELLEDLDEDDDDWSHHDSFDAHDSFDSHDSFDAHDSFGADDHGW